MISMERLCQKPMIWDLVVVELCKLQTLQVAFGTSLFQAVFIILYGMASRNFRAHTIIMGLGL